MVPPEPVFEFPYGAAEPSRADLDFSVDPFTDEIDRLFGGALRGKIDGGDHVAEDFTPAAAQRSGADAKFHGAAAAPAKAKPASTHHAVSAERLDRFLPSPPARTVEERLEAVPEEFGRVVTGHVARRRIRGRDGKRPTVHGDADLRGGEVEVAVVGVTVGKDEPLQLGKGETPLAGDPFRGKGAFLRERENRALRKGGESRRFPDTQEPKVSPHNTPLFGERGCSLDPEGPAARARRSPYLVRSGVWRDRVNRKLHIVASANDLARKLRRIDRSSYGAYRTIAGSYDFEDFILHIDRIQGDPFAAPSRLRASVPAGAAKFPPQAYEPAIRATGVATLLAKRFAREAARASSRRGSGKSGLIGIDTPAQQVLERTAMRVDRNGVEARFFAGLPAAGRRILAREAEEMLLDDLPAVIRSVLFYKSNDAARIEAAALTNEDAEYLRTALSEAGLVAFIADGAVLPRRSGVDDRPMGPAAVAFVSPPPLRREIALPNAGAVSGMGIPPGVTLIVGGGFHGKSTVLSALERAVYNHVPGDGRERVAAVAEAVKIRAEDGRSVSGVDISPFIGELPGGSKTRCFSTENASGSTSQAANIIEALEAGTTLLLVDEDTAATNFMIRDRRMQELIAVEKEPITPFVDKVRQLYDEFGVSSIIVAGGSGDYFDVADTVIAMDEYVPHDVTDRAREIARKHGSGRKKEGSGRFGTVTKRAIDKRSIALLSRRRGSRVCARGRDEIRLGDETIDLSALSQIVDESQTRAIAAAIAYGREKYMDGKTALDDLLRRILTDIDRAGLGVLASERAGDLARFRPLELAAAINRLRSLRVTPLKGDG